MNKLCNCFVLLPLIFSATVSASCLVEESDSNVQVQILGSGGPRGTAGRASSSYLLWVDGVGRILVDAGGGSKVTFEKSGANFNDIDLLALSHYHPDHSSELPAIFWPIRGQSVKISGPNGGGTYPSLFPSLEDFLENLFGTSGAYPILSDPERLAYDPITVNTSSDKAVEVWRDGDIQVRGISVPHGDIPAVGYRVDVGEHSIAFSGDQNGSDPSWLEFIEDVDVLVVHFGAGEGQANPVNGPPLHANPSVWGQMATDANVGRVIVSHITSESSLSESLEFFQSNYSGPFTVAEDLMCVEVL